MAGKREKQPQVSTEFKKRESWEWKECEVGLVLSLRLCSSSPFFPFPFPECLASVQGLLNLNFLSLFFFIFTRFVSVNRLIAFVFFSQKFWRFVSGRAREWYVSDISSACPIIYSKGCSHSFYLIYFLCLQVTRCKFKRTNSALWQQKSQYSVRIPSSVNTLWFN